MIYKDPGVFIEQG